jgi:hypothetical protein
MWWVACREALWKRRQPSRSLTSSCNHRIVKVGLPMPHYGNPCDCSYSTDGGVAPPEISSARLTMSATKPEAPRRNEHNSKSAGRHPRVDTCPAPPVFPDVQSLAAVTRRTTRESDQVPREWFSARHGSHRRASVRVRIVCRVVQTLLQPQRQQSPPRIRSAPVIWARRKSFLTIPVNL